MTENIGDKSVVIEARTDIRLLATLQQYMEEVGAKPQTKSELVKLSLEMAYAFALKLGKVKPYEQLPFAEANHILSIYGTLHKGNRNKAKLHALIAAEARVTDLLAPKPNAPMFSDPRMEDVGATFQAKISEAAMTLAEWNSLSTDIQALVKEKEPHLVPEGI